MSKYTLKFDLYDDIFLTRGSDLDYWIRSKIYVGHSTNEPIKIESMRDLMPYYNYVVSSAGYGENEATVYLTEKSWPELHIERYGDTYGLYQAMLEELKKDIAKYDAGELKSADLRE